MGNKKGFNILIIETNALLGKRWELLAVPHYIYFLRILQKLFNLLHPSRQNWISKVCFFCKGKIIKISEPTPSHLFLYPGLSQWKKTVHSLYYSSMVDCNKDRLINFEFYLKAILLLWQWLGRFLSQFLVCFNKEFLPLLMCFMAFELILMNTLS